MPASSRDALGHEDIQMNDSFMILSLRHAASALKTFFTSRCLDSEMFPCVTLQTTVDHIHETQSGPGGEVKGPREDFQNRFLDVSPHWN